MCVCVCVCECVGLGEPRRQRRRRRQRQPLCFAAGMWETAASSDHFSATSRYVLYLPTLAHTHTLVHTPAHTPTDTHSGHIIDSWLSVRVAFLLSCCVVSFFFLAFFSYDFMICLSASFWTTREITLGFGGLGFGASTWENVKQKMKRG